MNNSRNRPSRYVVILGSLILLCTGATFPAQAQNPIAVDDSYIVPAERTLSVEPIGVLENDTDADGENLPLTAVADLVADAGSGTLTLATDGSFTYTPPTGFLGEDFFTYRVLDDTLTSNTATVTLTVRGCTETVPVSTCWIESEFRARLINLGYSYIEEGFEDDAVWGSSRSPLLVAAVESNGITWTSNHAPNNLTTGSGAAVFGLWGVFSIPHGITTGSPFDPQHDGFMGTSVDSLFGVGGWIDSNTGGAAIEAILTTPPASPIVVNFAEPGVGSAPGFFGVIDTRGFTAFEFRETEGVVEDQKLIFADAFTLGTTIQTGVPDPGEEIPTPLTYHAPNPFNESTRIYYSIEDFSDVTIDVFDISGRRIRRLVDGSQDPGMHSVLWDRTTDSGTRVSSGIYWYAIRGLGRAMVVKKMVVQ